MTTEPQSTTQTILMPCPFCGSGAGDVPLSRGHGFIVGCSSCQAQQFAMSRDEAVKAWNSRAPAPTVAPEVDAWAIAQKVIADWHDYEKWHDPSMTPIPPFTGAQEQALTRLIAEAIGDAATTVAPVEQSNEDVSCPFCGEKGFDLAGLKSHLQKGDCEVFEGVERIERL